MSTINKAIPTIYPDTFTSENTKEAPKVEFYTKIKGSSI